MPSITIQTDTFCGTGCEYCCLPSREKNKAEYGFERLRNFCDIVKPGLIIPFGGDTYYDVQQSTDIFKFACSLDYVHTIATVSELPKLKRDIKTIAMLNEIVMAASKKYSLQFSADLFGNKTAYGDRQYLEELQKVTGIRNYLLTCVLTPQMLMQEDVPAAFKRFMDAYYNIDVGFIEVKINFDYNSARYKVPGLEAKTKEFMDSIYYTHNVVPFIVKDKFACRIGNSYTISPAGVIDACGIIVHEDNIGKGKHNALDITPERYEALLLDSAEHELKHNTLYCEKCDSKEYCKRCIKYVATAKDFDGTQAVCQFYKTFEKHRNRDMNEKYRGFFKL